jgi:hypothetical protein
MPSAKNHDSGRVRRERRLAGIAGAQNGVVTLRQLREIEITARSASHRAERGAMHRIHRGTYAVGHRSVGRLGALRAAALACGEGAVISHGTAAAYWGLRDRWPTLVDVIVPGQAGRKIDGVRCRRCRSLRPAEIAAPWDVPLTTPMRTLVDLAGMLAESSLRRTVERAAALKRLDLSALDDAICRAGGRRGIVTLRTIADEWRSEDGSVPDLNGDFEAMVLPRLMALGLPRPVCNSTLAFEERRLRVDFLWREQRLVVESDGFQTHATPIAFQRDRERDQLLLAAGYRVARVTWRQITDDAGAVADRIARALRPAGPN